MIKLLINLMILLLFNSDVVIFSAHECIKDFSAQFAESDMYINSHRNI